MPSDCPGCDIQELGAKDSPHEEMCPECRARGHRRQHRAAHEERQESGVIEVFTDSEGV